MQKKTHTPQDNPSTSGPVTPSTTSEQMDPCMHPTFTSNLIHPLQLMNLSACFNTPPSAGQASAGMHGQTFIGTSPNTLRHALLSSFEHQFAQSTPIRPGQPSSCTVKRRQAWSNLVEPSQPGQPLAGSFAKFSLGPHRTYTATSSYPTQPNPTGTGQTSSCTVKPHHAWSNLAPLHRQTSPGLANLISCSQTASSRLVKPDRAQPNLTRHSLILLIDPRQASPSVWSNITYSSSEPYPSRLNLITQLAQPCRVWSNLIRPSQRRGSARPWCSTAGQGQATGACAGRCAWSGAAGRRWSPNMCAK